MINEGLFTCNSDEWATPAALFAQMDAEFHFTLDPCASAENHKCATYYTQEENGLEQDWGGHTVFVNPPYSKIKAWVKKAYTESLQANTVVVMLIPARTDTSYFHDYIYGKAEVRFLRGRVKFVKDGDGTKPALFPSMIVVFGRMQHKDNRPELIAALYDAADSLKTSPQARTACENAAQALGRDICIHAQAKRVFVPFSGFVVAVCSICREPLETDSKTCKRCGAVIDWGRA